MQNKVPLLHLLVVPVVTILVCNGLTVNVLDALSGGVFLNITPLKYLIVCLTGLYGAYLHLFRNKNPRNYIILIATVVGGIFWIHFHPSFFIWLGGAALNFSVMRILILQRDWTALFMDLVYVLLGIVVALFLYPISFTFAVAAFLTIQIIFEMRRKSSPKMFHGNRFDESMKTAEKILNEYM